MQLFIRNSVKLKVCITTLFLFALIITLSCKKESIKDYYVPDSVRAYVSFKAGSYWIYKDDSTGTEDSIWVTHLESTWKARLNSNDEVIGNDERISCKININNSGLSGEYGAFQTGVGFRLFDWGFGFDFNENFHDWNNTLFYRDIVFVDTLRYNNVLNFIASDTSTNETFNYIDIYLSSNIGIVKWVILYNDSHSRRQHLVRYYLAQ